MSETIEGGIYKDATGDGFHDADGKPVAASKVAEAAKVRQAAVVATPSPAQPSVSDAPQTKEEAVQRLEVGLEQETGKDFVETGNTPPTLVETDETPKDVGTEPAKAKGK